MKQVPHSERAAVISCIDGRLVLADARYAARLRPKKGDMAPGFDFVIRMPGGGASVLTSEYREATIRSLHDAFGVRPFSRVILVFHVSCGKLASKHTKLFDVQERPVERLSPGGNEVSSLANLGNHATDILVQDFVQLLAPEGTQFTIETRVVGITRNMLFLPTGKISYRSEMVVPTTI